MVDELTKPVEEDVRYEDEDYNPAISRRRPRRGSTCCRERGRVRELERPLRQDRQAVRQPGAAVADMAATKNFRCSGPTARSSSRSIYAKPPIPVVVPKFKDRRPVYQAASEVMERCCIVAFDLPRINDLMMLVRDDLSLTSRGVAWCRYESGKGGGYYDHEKVCIDFKSRRDFLHSISRNWREVTWVAAASYLTRGEARKRFQQALAATPTRRPSTRSTKRARGRRRRQPRARQVLGDLAQGRQARGVGRPRLRGHPRRGRPASGPAKLLPVPEARLRHGAARLVWCLCPTSCSTATSSRRSTC